MKTIKSLVLAITALFLFSCEETVTVDLENATPRLVVDASIQWIKGTSGNEQKIKLTTTSSYYNTSVPYVSGATVFITNSTGTVFPFTEIPNSGEYVCTNFLPVINESYTLTVAYNGQIFNATETLVAVPDIEPNIEQNNEGGFTGEDIEIKFFFQDNLLEDNFYLTRFQMNNKPFPEYAAVDDRFFQGNQIFGFFSNEDLKTGDQLDIKLYGISQQYYNYMSVLLSVSGTNGGSPFQTPPATVRGNVIHQADENQFALGYFNLSQVDTTSYVVQ